MLFNLKKLKKITLMSCLCAVVFITAAFAVEPRFDSPILKPEFLNIGDDGYLKEPSSYNNPSGINYNNVLRTPSNVIVGADGKMQPSGRMSRISPMPTETPKKFNMPLLEGGVSITDNPTLLTMSLRDSDCRQLLRMLADKAGMNIIIHDSVSGNVTLDLVNITLNKAFEYVMILNNLSYWIDGNTLIVASKDASKDLGFAQQQIRTFDVKYENAGRIAEFLNKNIYKLKNPGLSCDDIAITNPSTNQIMIIGTQKDFDIAQKVIAQFDRKNETVLYKVNHMTPGKMAGIICHKVFGTEDMDDYDEESEGKGGAKIACTSKDIENSEVEGVFESFKGMGLVVTYYPDLGTIGITGATPEQLAFVDEIITQNDIKQPQAVLEIAVLELMASGNKQLTPFWSVTAGTVGITSSQGALSLDFNLNKVIADSRANSTSTQQANTLNNNALSENGYTNTGANFMTKNQYYQAADTLQTIARLTYAVQNGKGRILANPKVLVKNNVESTINITQDYVSNIKAQQSATTYQPLITQTVEIGQYGIQITVKPTITPDGYVYLDLKPSYSTPTSTAAVNGSSIELLGNRDLEIENVRLKDNETLIVGGLIWEREQKTVNKTPFLGDLPIVGTAFRSSSNSKSKQELIIIVTPKIISEDEPVSTVKL